VISKGKGNAARLSYLADSPMEQRHSLTIGLDIHDASGTGERVDAPDPLTADDTRQGSTLGAETDCDPRDLFPH